MRKLSIDLETASPADIRKGGVYRYAEKATILLFGYSVDGGPVRVLDLRHGDTIPDRLVDAIRDPKVEKWAHNATFERVLLSHHFGLPVGEYLDPAGWRCTMCWALSMGLPPSLAQCASTLGIKQGKLDSGKRLIDYFCTGKARRQNDLMEDEMWQEFITYNRRDVEVEMQIARLLRNFDPGPEFWADYENDQRVNDRGVMIDLHFARTAMELGDAEMKRLKKRMHELTGLDNPNSVQQLCQWLQVHGIHTKELDKKTVAVLLRQDPPQDVKDVLRLRGLAGKSSLAKYQAMLSCACSDGRARGLFQYHGSRTGRWAGRAVQLQNLPQNHINDIATVRQKIAERNTEGVENLTDTLSQLIRTAFIPAKGHTFLVADFSSIEARVIAWLAGEQWVLDAFRKGKDIYCETASRMFHVPVEKNGRNAHLRQKGKVATLACIAENEPVLTDRGLVPIQDVTERHLLWDGESWVKHEGVVFNGIREVIDYDGLRATGDHLVWVEGQSWPVQFAEAAARGARLIQTGGAQEPCSGLLPCVHTRFGPTRVYDIRNAGPHHRFTVSGRLVHNCGYGGAVGALKAFGALEMGLQEMELRQIVDDWRAANPQIVRFWWDVDRAVRDALNGNDSCVGALRFECRSHWLFIFLPSGRRMAYFDPQLDGDQVSYMGMTPGHQWERVDSYGPKFVENIVQATARDLLCHVMRKLGSSVVMHVHDEVIVETPADGWQEWQDVCEIMKKGPAWAKGLPLNADGYQTDFYQKQ